MLYQHFSGLRTALPPLKTSVLIPKCPGRQLLVAPHPLSEFLHFCAKPVAAEPTQLAKQECGKGSLGHESDELFTWRRLLRSQEAQAQVPAGTRLVGLGRPVIRSYNRLSGVQSWSLGL